VKETALRSGAEAAQAAVVEGRDPEGAKRKASAPFAGFRFHDLRHQAVTELAESGASDAKIMGLTGHLSRRMMEHSSHVRMGAKRTAVEGLGRGLSTPQPLQLNPASQSDSVQ